MPSNYKPKSSKKPKPVPGKPGVSRVKDYPREVRHPTGRAWERVVATVIAYHNGICHLCDHPGAKQGDHLVPVTERPDLAEDPKNIRPAHGSAGKQVNPCPTCGLNCNNIRGMGSVARARRIIEKRQGKAPQEDGREW